ncbi:MAG: hypothetical protein JNK14_12600 [Chitinophagaceae bacterium]|nr:hypothetical protein [Chitinophagaceae bacterium]
MITAKKIDTIVKTGALHALYREDGKWYNNLRYFPATLFDINGYIIFNNESEYLNNKHLKHGKRLNISVGISQIRGYQKFTEDVKRQVLNLL